MQELSEDQNFCVASLPFSGVFFGNKLYLIDDLLNPSRPDPGRRLLILILYDTYILTLLCSASKGFTTKKCENKNVS